MLSVSDTRGNHKALRKLRVFNVSLLRLNLALHHELFP
jgi:hypothetical protein